MTVVTRLKDVSNIKKKDVKKLENTARNSVKIIEIGARIIGSIRRTNVKKLRNRGKNVVMNLMNNVTIDAKISENVGRDRREDSREHREGRRDDIRDHREDRRGNTEKPRDSGVKNRGQEGGHQGRGHGGGR